MIDLRHALLTMLTATFLGSGVTLPAQAQDSPPASTASVKPTPALRPWSSLNAAQRDMLAPLQSTWDTLSPRRQAHMLKRAERWVTLTPERRAAIREHIAHWQQMTPEEREQARANMRKFRDLSAQQREQLHATFERFQQLPPAQRDKLMREWHALTPEQRLHWSMPLDAGQTPSASMRQHPTAHSEPSGPQQPSH